MTALLAFALGCTSKSSGTSSGSQQCNPLATADAPIALSTLLGVGRHADGTLYALDDGRPDYRLFVSEGSVLQRKVVLGSGTAGGTADGTIVVTSGDTLAPFTLKIERSAGKAARMGVYRGELKGKDFEIGSQGDVLEVVGADALASLTVRNVPGNVVVEYDAMTPQGRRLFVTRPAIDWRYEDFRMFYGTPDRMTERRVASVARGSSTYITFDIDGASANAFFPSPGLSAPGSVPTLTVNDQVQNLTLVAADAGAAGSGLSFYCF